MKTITICPICKGEENNSSCICKGLGVTINKHKKQMIEDFNNIPEDSSFTIKGIITNVYETKEFKKKAGGTFKFQNCKIADANGVTKYIEFPENMIQNESMVKGRAVVISDVRFESGQYPKFKCNKGAEVKIVGGSSSVKTSNHSQGHMNLRELIQAQAEVALRMHKEIMDSCSNSELANACAVASITGVAEWWFGDKAPTGLNSFQSTESEEEEVVDTSESQETEDWDEDSDWEDEEENDPVKTMYNEIAEAKGDSNAIKEILKKNKVKPKQALTLFIKASIIEEKPQPTEAKAFAKLKEIDEIPY